MYACTLCTYIPMCIYVRTYVCTYVHTYVHAYAIRIYVCTYVHNIQFTATCLKMHIHTHVPVSKSTSSGLQEKSTVHSILHEETKFSLHMYVRTYCTQLCVLRCKWWVQPTSTYIQYIHYTGMYIHMYVVLCRFT